LASVRCAFVPGNDSAACNILLDFFFGFSREVVGPVLAVCSSRLHSVFCSGVAIFFVCRNRFRPSGLRFLSWFYGQLRSSVGFDFLCCRGSVLLLCLCSPNVRPNIYKVVSIFYLRVNSYRWKTVLFSSHRIKRLEFPSSRCTLIVVSRAHLQGVR
jgi:hypothetical protein